MTASGTTASTTARAASSADRPWSETRFSHTIWAQCVAEELDRLAWSGELSAAEVRWAINRAERARDCGRMVVMTRCRCGTAIPSSMHAMPGGAGWCEMRGCPICSRRRSAKLAGLAARAAAGVPEGSTWWFLTGTTARDPDDPAECRWQALRARARKCRRGMTKVIAKIRKAREMAAAWSGIEASGNGHVHAHLLVVLAPGETRPDFDSMIRAAGFDEIADSRPADPSAVVEVVKYSLKTPRFEKQINASGQKQPHPDLAAHWALATRGMRLIERYGLARQVETLDTEPPPVEAVDEITPCPCCGSVSLLDRWQIAGVAEAVASWAARTWHGSPDHRLTGDRWPKGASRHTALALAIPLSRVSGPVAVVVDNEPKPGNTPSWMY